jgi:hypothetical protein
MWGTLVVTADVEGYLAKNPVAKPTVQRRGGIERQADPP